MKKIPVFLLVIKICIGILIAILPIIVTGHMYDVSRLMGGLLIADFVMRITCLIIGLLIIYDSIKSIDK
ncbi:hypothetical protein JYK21_09080 [Ralstonia pickettii]|nr:hypothetical protein [Ralstonia pickettii]